jgi:glycerol-3-phosphate O-acyltransferase
MQGTGRVPGPRSEPKASEGSVRGGATPVDDPYTAMTPRFNALAGSFARRFFARFELAGDDSERLRALESRGAVVYVMRYGSRLDYLLFNWLFLAAGLRLSSGANGILFYYYRPLRESLPLAFRHLSERVRHGRAGLHERARSALRRILGAGASGFLFLRTDKIAPALQPRSWALRSARREIDQLRELVDACSEAPDRRVALVPLALFWRKGPAQQQRSFLDVFYGGPERPRSWVKLLSFLLNYRGLAVRVGEPVELREVIARYGHEGRERVVKRVRRSLLIFLRREERPVVGPALRSFARVHAAVLAHPDVAREIEAADGAAARARERALASRHLQRIAANPGPVVLAVLSVSVRWIMRRLFTRFEVHGLDAIIEAAKSHPLVLLPGHRSHFDYVILSSLFYERHVVPPHVAAGDNLAFWPLGALFRRAGAFFLRRTFEGDRLYTAVFRAYLQLLIKDGVTQEFFIEGTRSRTGKTLQPRLGLLRMVVEAYARGVRRELYLVPVGFTYDRLVEESSLTEQRRGAPKRGENLLGLLRARAVLGRRFGAVGVRFGVPLPLSRVLAAARESPAGEPDLRELTRGLALELSRAINEQISASCSAVAAAGLLASPDRAVREPVFCERVIETAALLELLGVALDPALVRCIDERRPAGAAAMLVVAGYVQRRGAPRDAYLEIEAGDRDRLDYYRASLTPALVWPAVLALALREASARDELFARAGDWLELLALEYFPVAGAERRARLERVLEHERARGWLVDAESGVCVAPDAASWQEFWIAQIRPVLEAYAALVNAVARAGGRGTREGLVGAALAAHRDRLALGEARHPEGSCPVASGNALDLLLERGILAGAGSGPDARFSPGARWSELGALEVFLAGASAPLG